MTTRTALGLVSTLTLCLLLGLGWFWQENRRLKSSVRNLELSFVKAERDFQSRGSSIVPSGEDKLHQTTDRSAETISNETLAAFDPPEFLNELEQAYDQRDLPRAIQQMSVVASLSAAELKDLLARIENGELSGEGTGMLREVVLRTFAQRDPEGAANYSLDKGLKTGVTTALREWGKADVDASLAWFEEKREAGELEGRQLSDDGNEIAQANLLAGIAQADMARAIEILNAPDAEGVARGLRGVVLTLTDDASRKEFIDLVEKTGNESLHHEALDAVTLNVLNKEGFDSATAFFENSDLDPSRHSKLIRDLTRSGLNDTNVGDAASRLEWALSQSSQDKQSENIRGFVSKWTQLDHAAAAQWLGKVEPEAVYRDGAIREFVATVVSRDPRGAFDWSRVIGDESVQQEVMGKVYEHWHKRNPNAAEDYVRGVGMAPESLTP